MIDLISIVFCHNHIIISLMFQDRDMSLGVCLPAACEAADVQTLLETTSVSNDPKHRLNLLRVRAIPGPYSLPNDPKFHIMGWVDIVTIIAIAYRACHSTFLLPKCVLARSRVVYIHICIWYESGIWYGICVSYQKTRCTYIVPMQLGALINWFDFVQKLIGIWTPSRCRHSLPKIERVTTATACNIRNNIT